ncbi:metaxin related [Holotrichia oblita]|uniref:Metaxin related n=1 Tax=Holotrichia oblita TaxID=644536 RepID=A0ACB9SWA5_HOLOL|nr:metaxin related [Holotrichia oblita]
MDNKMELTIWEGDYGLPSICPDCIYMMLYTKIAKVPIDYKHHNNPYWDMGESFPIFKHGGIYTSNIQLIIGYLRIKRYGTEFGLSSKQCSQSYAFSSLAENSLRPILEYVWWVDHRNYEEFTRPWFIKAMPMPVNYLYPRCRRQKANALLASLFSEYENQDLLSSFMFNMAEKCFTTLKVRLGSADYFYGAAPTSLDAMIYAYLAPLMKLPFPSNEIPRLLNTYKELVDFIKRIDAEYYPDLKREAKYAIGEKKDDNNNADASPLSIRAKLVALLFAVSAMLLYASTHKALPKLFIFY